MNRLNPSDRHAAGAPARWERVRAEAKAARADADAHRAADAAHRRAVKASAAEKVRRACHAGACGQRRLTRLLASRAGAVVSCVRRSFRRTNRYRPPGSTASSRLRALDCASDGTCKYLLQSCGPHRHVQGTLQKRQRPGVAIRRGVRAGLVRAAFANALAPGCAADNGLLPVPVRRA